MKDNKFVLKYYIVLVSKAKKEIFSKEIVNTLQESIEKICKKLNVQLVEFGAQKDHIHLYISTTPQIKLSDLMQTIKKQTNSILKKQHKKEIKKHYMFSPIWAKKHFITSVQGVALDAIQQYLMMDDFKK